MENWYLNYPAEDTVRCWIVSQIRNSPSDELERKKKRKKEASLIKIYNL